MLSVLQTQLKPHLYEVRGWLTENPRLALSSAAALLGATYLASSTLKNNQSNLPPGPKPLPVIGSRHLLDYTKIHESLYELGKKYGDVFTVYVFSEPIVILNSYNAIKEGLCSDRNLLAGRPYAEDYLDCMNEEVFMGDFSDHWKMAKKSGITALKKFAGPQSDIEEVMQDEVDFLVNTFTKSAGTPQTSDNLKTILYKATGNIMSSFIFGVHYDDHDDPELENFTDGIKNWYVYVNNSFPWDGFDPQWLVRYNFGNGLGDFKKTNQRMRDHCKNIMKRTTVDRENPRSFLEYFMATRDMDAMGGIDGFADTICLYTVDPVDTMAVLVQWSMLYLAYFPDVQKRLEQRISEVLGSGQRVTSTHRADLGLVESFLHELQRHCNLTCTLFPHTSTRDSKFRGHDLPKGTMVYANVYASHVDPEVHSEPEKFKVDRFVDENGKFRKADSVFTFGTGARSCPGDIHTRMELYLVIANLVNRFHITFPPRSPKPDIRMQDKYFFKIPREFQVVFTER